MCGEETHKYPCTHQSTKYHYCNRSTVGKDGQRAPCGTLRPLPDISHTSGCVSDRCQWLLKMPCWWCHECHAYTWDDVRPYCHYCDHQCCEDCREGPYLPAI
ncbi:hypothetical protein PG984_008017 [Apiospora sp. TS-2023a]